MRRLCLLQGRQEIAEKRLKKLKKICKKTGRFGCIGKQLALMEIRTVVSSLIVRFDVSLAPGEDGTELLERTKDTFTLRIGDLNIVFQGKEEVQRRE